MSTNLIRFALSLLIVMLLAFPFAALFYHAGWETLFFGPSVFAKSVLISEIVEVADFTFLQSALSAGMSVVVGVVGALGLTWASTRWGFRRTSLLEAVVLLPNVAPVLVLLLAVMKFFPLAKGLPGIVFVHTLLNSGLVSVAFVRILRQKVSGMAELAWVEGATGIRFFVRGVLPYLHSELMLLFLFVFALCFMSFAVPLMLGGPRATTLETLVYQKIRMYGEWGEAIQIALLQLAAVFAFSWVLRRGTAASGARTVLSPLLSWRWGLIPILVAPLLLFVGLTADVPLGLRKLEALPALMSELPGLLFGSFAVALGVGGFSVALLLMLSYVNPKGLFRRFLIGYAAPSSVLMGFALLIASHSTGAASYFKMIVGITLVSVPSFYRLKWDSLLQSLEGQRVVAWSLGASESQIFHKVIFAQVIRSACFISGVAALWAWGDFALSAVVAERSLTLALLIGQLMGSYRLEAATVLSWLLMVGGAVTFAVFIGVGHVFSSKS